MNRFRLTISVLGVIVLALGLWLIGSSSRYLRTAAVPPANLEVPVPEAKIITLDTNPPDQRSVAAEVLEVSADQLLSWPGPKGTFWAQISEVAGTKAPIGTRVYFIHRQ